MPLLHSIVFLSPIPLTLLTPPGASSDGWLALFALETLLYVVGAAFIIVIMTQERIALGHKTAAMTDPLTGLFNRRAFYELGQQLMAQQARTKAAVSVLAFDLDHFKSINDRFGHAVGDDTLRLFAATARANVRATDVLARLGGEEFVAILPGGAAEAAMVGERLRAAFQAAAVEISSHRIRATVSVGIATAAAAGADRSGCCSRPIKRCTAPRRTAGTGLNWSEAIQFRNCRLPRLPLPKRLSQCDSALESGTNLGRQRDVYPRLIQLGACGVCGPGSNASALRRKLRRQGSRSLAATRAPTSTRPR